jgi:hypothetical protein
MSPGRVVRIRVNPKDCLGAVDVLAAAKIHTNNMSFDQVVRLALSILLEQARVIEQIPRRDGFEYNDVMSTFATRGPEHHVEKLKRTQQIELESLYRHTSDMPPALGRPLRTPPPPDTPDQARARVLLAQLAQKFEHNQLNWSPQDGKLMGWLGEVAAGEISFHEYEVLSGQAQT